MKLALLLFLLALCGSNLFGKQPQHIKRHIHKLHKRVHRVRRHMLRKPTVSVQATISVPGLSDSRHLALLQYFRACNCPAVRWANIFVQEADRQGLDWRLVASISMVESTGGKHYKNRNILGWGSASARFRSEQAGIKYVSARLSHSRLYRGKSLMQVLKTYNSVRRNYTTLVTGIMQRLADIEGHVRVQQASLVSHALSPFQSTARTAAEPVFLN